MFIETVPNRTSPPAVLLRESYRDEQDRAQKRTLANLSKLPGDVIDGLRVLLKGGTVIGTGADEMQIERSLQHGHVAAARRQHGRPGDAEFAGCKAQGSLRPEPCGAGRQPCPAKARGGMITSARFGADLKPAGMDWITCLRAPAIQALAAENGPLQLSLFDERDLAEISAPEMFPGERLIVCRNRELAAERARKREELLLATERGLLRIQAQVRRRHAPLRGAAEIGLAVGAVVNSRKMAKHFAIEIRDGHFAFQRRTEQIEQEARLDGIYVIRTSVPAEQLDAKEAVQAYKDLSRVERAFRSLKTIDLDIRPIRHWTAPRVRAHVFLCMLAYHVEWHLRDALAPLLFHDTELAATRAERSSPIVSTEPSEAAKAKKATKRTADGLRVMGFAGLMTHLGTLTRNTMRVPLCLAHRFTLYAEPTKLQEDAFRLLNIQPMRVQ